jgi:hypothetical protein
LRARVFPCGGCVKLGTPRHTQAGMRADKWRPSSSIGVVGGVYAKGPHQLAWVRRRRRCRHTGARHAAVAWLAWISASCRRAPARRGRMRAVRCGAEKAYCSAVQAISGNSRPRGMRPARREVDCGAVPAIPSGSSSRGMRRCTRSLRRGVWRRSCSQIPTDYHTFHLWLSVAIGTGRRVVVRVRAYFCMYLRGRVCVIHSVVYPSERAVLVACGFRGVPEEKTAASSVSLL